MTTPNSAHSPLWRTHLERADPRSGWEGAQWTSAPLTSPFAADQAIASWNLEAGVRATIEIRAGKKDGSWYPWQLLAEWGPAGERRTAEPPAAEAAPEGPRLDTDVLKAQDGDTFDAVQVRISLSDASPTASLHLVSVNFSAPATPADVLSDAFSEGQPQGAAGAVRSLSQRAYPARDDLGGGGPVWCSPTSLTMVLDAWGAEIPESPADAPDGADPRVPWVAREVFDTIYNGTGNWPFNAAVAGSLGYDAVITRLPSLREARVLTDAGIPVITSIRFADRADLPGADYDAPTGHLVVVRGFTSDGDVLVADPASPGGEAGFRTYDRQAFDMTWARSRRTAYLVTPRGHTLPEAPGDVAW